MTTRRRKRRNKLPAEAVELTISGISHEGRGVSHIEGKVAFVDGSLPDEIVSANYVRNRSQFAEFKTLEVKKCDIQHERKEKDDKEHLRTL